MHRDLKWIIAHVLLALLMIVCSVIHIVNGNIFGLCISVAAFGLNVSSALDHYRDYKHSKAWDELHDSISKLDEAMKACWPDRESKIE